MMGLREFVELFDKNEVKNLFNALSSCIVQGVGRTARVRRRLPCHEVGLAVRGQDHTLIR